MGKPAARIGDMHVCPMFEGPKPHVGGPITGSGVATVLIGGVPAATMGDICACMGEPDTIVMGSSGVLIGGKPAARMGDQCSHGGSIIIGMPTVLIGETSSGSVALYESAIVNLPKDLQKKVAQIITMKEAALHGTPFCEKCEEAAMKG